MPVPQIDFSPIGDLYNTYRQSQQQATRDQVLGGLAQGGGPLNYGDAARQLLAAGDTQGGMSLAHLAQQQYLTSPEYIDKIARTKAQVEQEFAPKTTNIKMAGGDEVTVEKGPQGYRIPQVQGLPTQSDVPVPAGVDPKEYRKKLAEAHVANQEATVKDAKAAADFEPVVDQAVAAYERAIKASAIGPIAGSTPARLNEKYNPLARNDFPGNIAYQDPEKEKARQDYDKAKGALQARITAAQNKGEGAVSNFERQMYAAQFPDLTSVEPEKGLEYLKQIQAQTKQTKSAAGTTSLGTTPSVSAVLDRPSIPNGMAVPPTPQRPNAWQNPQTISAARADPQATLEQARQAIQSGKDPQAVAKRLQQIGIDPSPLFGGQPGFAGPGQRQ